MINENKKIGGEFEINLSNLINFNPFKEHYNHFLFSNGRSALAFLLQLLKKEKKHTIHLPFYICPSVVQVSIAAGFKIKFYELDDNLLFPIYYIEEIGFDEILIIVNYFGFTDDNKIIKQIKRDRNDITIIGDHVQSFWTLNKSEADYTFTSLRKHFPVPDGALLFSNNFTFSIPDIPENIFYYSKLIGSILKSQQLPDEIYLYYLNKGESLIHDSSNFNKASLLSHYLFESLNFKQISSRRKENCKYIYESDLKDEVEFVFNYSEDIIPMNIPVIVKNRNIVLNKLKKCGIFLPVHWTINDYNNTSTMSKFMSENEMSLIVDQRYSNEDMLYQVEKLIQAIKY